MQLGCGGEGGQAQARFGGVLEVRAGVGEEDEGHGWRSSDVCVCGIGGWGLARGLCDMVLGVSSDERVGSGWCCGGEGGDDFFIGYRGGVWREGNVAYWDRMAGALCGFSKKLHVSLQRAPSILANAHSISQPYLTDRAAFVVLNSELGITLPSYLRDSSVPRLP